MNPRMMVRSLTIEGPEGSETYSFSPGVNVIVGGVGTGKTSMLQAIKHALGGNAIRSAAVRDGVTTTTVEVEVNARRLQFKRRSTDRLVEVVDVTSRELIARAMASGPGAHTKPSASDVLLDALGIPRIALPRARRRPTSQTTTISFWDIFEYMYVRQIEMDSGIAQHDDPIRDPKRRATFEILYGITDEETAALERRIGGLRTSIADTKKWLAAIAAFLADAEEQPESVLRLELERVEVDLRNAVAALEGLRAEARSTTRRASGSRTNLADQERQLAEARTASATAELDIQKLEAVAAQVSVNLERLERADVAVRVISPFEFRQCPRCLQTLANRQPDESVCVLCLQDDVKVTPEAIHEEHARLEAQLAETGQLLESSRGVLTDAYAREHEIEHAVAELNREIDAETAAFVSERFHDIEQASRAASEFRGRRERITRSLELHDRVRVRSDQLHQDTVLLREAEARLVQARGQLEAGKDRVRDLSRMFDDLLQQFGYPWYDPSQGSRIDLDTYLPVTGQETFDEASAGMRTLLNVAYHMAGLRYGLQNGDSLLPTMLILDSPRKNLGTLTDRDIGARIYRRMRALDEAFRGQFQMLVADNDPPPLTQDFTTISLSYARPFVPWLNHPGPTVEPIEQ